MQTVLKIKVSDLDVDFVKAIKTLFKHNQEIEITVSPANDFGLNKTETKQEYIDRLKKSIKNAEAGNIIAFTDKEFETVNKNLLGKR